MVSITKALIERRTPWRDWQPVRHQLTAMGFRSVGDDEQGRSELAAMLWFLDTWLDLIPMTDGIFWSDPHDESEDD
jgi:hypothetical protein